MKTYLINLDKRPDRLLSANENLFMAGFKYKRFAAVEHAVGRIGVILSLKKLFEENINEPMILVFEDDVKFLVDNASERFQLALDEVPKTFDMLFLGANVLNMYVSDQYEHIYKLLSAVSLHAVVYSQRAMRKILRLINEQYRDIELKSELPTQRAIDMAINGIIAQKDSFICKEFLATQSPSYSDIENKFIDWQFCLQDRYYKRVKK